MSQRAAWQAPQSEIAIDQLVFIDETGGLCSAPATCETFGEVLAFERVRYEVHKSAGLARLQRASPDPGCWEEAAAKDIVLVAINWSKLPAALAGLPGFGGRDL